MQSTSCSKVRLGKLGRRLHTRISMLLDGVVARYPREAELGGHRRPRWCISHAICAMHNGATFFLTAPNLRQDNGQQVLNAAGRIATSAEARSERSQKEKPETPLQPHLQAQRSAARLRGEPCSKLGRLAQTGV